MFGPPLALLARSLSIDLRLRRTHLLRLAFAFIVLVMLLFAQWESLTLGAPGLHFFTGITWLNFLFITVAGASYFATAITEEKDEATLGLLMMAGISPVTLMLGKSTSRLLTALLILVIQLPFTLLAVTLGGMLVNQVAAIYLTLAAWMILVANLGLFCSVACRTSAWAAFLACVLIGLVLAAPEAVEGLANGVLGQSDQLVELARQVNVLERIDSILQTGFAEQFGQSLIHPQVWVSLLLAAGFFGVSWASFEFFTSDRAVRGGFSARSTAGAFAKGWRRPARLQNAPVVWKDFHFIAGGYPWMTLKAAAYGLLAAGLFGLEYAGRSFAVVSFENVGSQLMFWTLAGGALELSLYASRLFREEAHRKTLPALLMIPATTGRIARAKVAGCLLGLVPAVSFFALGALLSPDKFLEGAAGLLNPPAWYSLAEFIVFLHATAYLSLVVKWGALPIAFLSVVVFGSCCTSPLFVLVFLAAQPGGALAGLAACVPIVAAMTGLCALFQHAILRRLDLLASQ